MPDIVLMNKDKPVASYSESFQFGKPTYELIKQYDAYLPYGYKSIDTWLEHRPVARHRRHVAELMKQCGCDNIRGYIDIMHAVSLTDTFWVKNTRSDLCWADVSLYTNEFDEAISRTAFDGNGLYGIRLSSDRVSPELTTDGTYDKCWHRSDQKIWLLKSGSEGSANAGMEPYSEKLASDLLDAAGCRHVKYELCRFHGKLVSRCELFTSEEIGYVPFSAYLSEQGSDGSLRDILRFIETTGISEEFYHMLAYDAVMVNVDRHTGNFGLLVDNDTGRILGMAPLFDHNLALRPAMMKEDAWKEDLIHNCNTAFGTDFILTAKDAMQQYPSIRSDLISLKSFSFSDPGYGFPSWRTARLNEILQLQISRILG